MKSNWTKRLLVILFTPFIVAIAISRPVPQSTTTQNTDAVQFSVQSQLVEVFLTVKRENRWAPNLTVSDFRLLENGSEVPIVQLDNRDVPLQVVLLFDVSESIRDSLHTVQDAVVAFVQSLHPEDRMMLVFFGSQIRTYPQTGDDRESILHAIKNVRVGGMTRLHDAMLLGMRWLKDKKGRKAMVCFTDGQDTSGTTSRSSVRDAAARFGYPIYMIGTGAGLELSSLKMILSDFARISSGRAFFIQTLGKLRNAFVDVAEELRSAYVLHYYTEVPPDGRWHDLRVETVDPAYTVHARRGFYAANKGNP